MRISIFFLIFSIFCFQLSQAQQIQVRITEDFNNQDLRSVLRILNENYAIKFAYDDELVKDVSITASFDKTPVSEVIKVLLHQTGLKSQWVNETLMIIPLEQDIIAEVRMVSVVGAVQDRTTDEPLPFANILLVSSNQSVASNADGRFSIPSIPDTTRLKVYYLGYRPEELLVRDFTESHMVIQMVSQAEELDEVVVRGDRSGTLELSDGLSQISINPQKLSSLPNLGEIDVFRTLQLLPGVSGTDETSSGLAIRGSTPDQNLVLYDGFTLYHIDHFYGVYSAFNSHAIKNIQLFKGGFDAKYGGRASSVIDITGKNGSSKPSVGLGLNLIGANAIAELPIGKKIKVLGAFRRSYTDIIQSNLYKDLFDNVFSSSIDARSQDLPQFEDIEPVFYFYDLNTKISYNPSDKDIIAFSFYNSQDNLSLESREFLNDNFFTDIDEDTKWGNTGGSLRWARQWNSRYYTNVYLARSNYFSDTKIIQGFGLIQPDTSITFELEQNNDVKDFTGKIDNEYVFGPKSILQFGMLYARNDVELTSRFEDQSFQQLDQKANQLAVYLQHVWKPVSSLELNLGIRTNYVDLKEKNYWEPRISAQYQINKFLTIKTAAGLNHQFINRIVRQELFQSNPDFWILSENLPDINLPEVESRQYVLGLQFETEHLLIDIEGYYKFSDGIIEYIPRLSNFQQATQVSGNLYRIGENITKGVDILVEKKVGKYTGWIAYTLSKSENKFQGLNNNEAFPSRLDQRHELKLVNMVSLGNWDLALNWVYGSGKPYSAPSGTYTLTFLDSARQEFAAIDNFNAQRLPDYHRMDFSATYNFKIGKGKAQTGISIFNLYGRQNVKFRKFTRINFDEETLEILPVPKFIVNDVKLLGFTPNIFIRYNL